jgi:hypothetical protein
LVAGVQELAVVVVVAQRIVCDTDAVVGVGGLGSELEDHFGVLQQRVLELVVPAVELSAESIGADVFKIEAKAVKSSRTSRISTLAGSTDINN